MPELSASEIENIKHDTAIKIGGEIRKIREQKKLTQVQLANHIQSDRQYLYKIEKGKVGVSFSKLVIIAKALDVSLTELTARI